MEIFFRYVKQLLHIKSFVGTIQNAVMIQIWSALITLLVLKALKAIAKVNWNLFVKISLQHWLDEPFEENHDPPEE